MYFLSIDPGLNHVGYALWHLNLAPPPSVLADVSLNYAKLTRAGLVRLKYEPGTERAEKWRLMGRQVWRETPEVISQDIRVISEIPQVYTREKSKGDPNDLIDLAGVVGAIVSQATAVEWSPVPRDWKGNLPKEVTAQRVMNGLKPDEHKLIQPCPPSLLHNTYDAIHLGLVYLKREGLR